MTKRKIAIFAATLILIGSGIVLCRNVKAARPNHIPTTTVVVAVRDIAPLQTIQPGDVQIKTVPMGTLTGALNSIPYGSAAKVPLVSGQVVMQSDLGPAVPTGDALVGVQTTLAQSSGIVRPGQTVEIVSVVAGAGQTQTSSIVLGKDTVVAMESSQGTPVAPGTSVAATNAAQASAQAEVPSEVTLLVPQVLAPKVNAADASGKIYLDVIP